MTFRSYSHMWLCNRNASSCQTVYSNSETNRICLIKDSLLHAYSHQTQKCYSYKIFTTKIIYNNGCTPQELSSSIHSKRFCKLFVIRSRNLLGNLQFRTIKVQLSKNVKLSLAVGRGETFLLT